MVGVWNARQRWVIKLSDTGHESSRRSRVILCLVSQHTVEAWCYLWLLKDKDQFPMLMLDAQALLKNSIFSTRNGCTTLHFTDYLCTQLCRVKWIASYPPPPLFTRYYRRRNTAFNSVCVSYFVCILLN